MMNKINEFETPNYLNCSYGKKCLYYESLFDYQKEIDEILDNIMKIEINSDTDNTYNDLL